MPHIPTQGTLAERVLAFFRANATEELEAVDIAAKFGCSSSSVPALLATALRDGLIVRKKNGLGSWIYIAGPSLFKTAATPAPAPADPAAGAANAEAAWPAPKRKAASGRRSPLPLLDVSALAVRRNVDTAAASLDARRAAYYAALDKLDAPATAIDVEQRYRGAITKAAQDYVKRPGHEGKRFAFRRHATDERLCTVLREA